MEETWRQLPTHPTTHRGHYQLSAPPQLSGRKNIIGCAVRPVVLVVSADQPAKHSGFLTPKRFRYSTILVFTVTQHSKKRPWPYKAAGPIRRSPTLPAAVRASYVLERFVRCRLEPQTQSSSEQNDHCGQKRCAENLHRVVNPLVDFQSFNPSCHQSHASGSLDRMVDFETFASSKVTPSVNTRQSTKCCTPDPGPSSW